jgi:hypothetical protein
MACPKRLEEPATASGVCGDHPLAAAPPRSYVIGTPRPPNCRCSTVCSMHGRRRAARAGDGVARPSLGRRPGASRPGLAHRGAGRSGIAGLVTAAGTRPRPHGRDARARSHAVPRCHRSRSRRLGGQRNRRGAHVDGAPCRGRAGVRRGAGGVAVGGRRVRRGPYRSRQGPGVHRCPQPGGAHTRAGRGALRHLPASRATPHLRTAAPSAHPRAAGDRSQGRRPPLPASGHHPAGGRLPIRRRHRRYQRLRAPRRTSGRRLRAGRRTGRAAAPRGPPGHDHPDPSPRLPAPPRRQPHRPHRPDHRHPDRRGRAVGHHVPDGPVRRH